MINRRTYLKSSGMAASVPFLLGNVDAVGQAQAQRGNQPEDTNGDFVNPGIGDRTKFRWAIPGAHAETEQLAAELEAMADAGYGGAEVTLMSIPEPETQGLGTDAWSDRLQTILEVGSDIGLEIDLHISGQNGVNLTTPTVSPDEPGASKELVHGEEVVTGGDTYDGTIPEPEAAVGEYSQVPFIQTVLAEEVTEKELIAVQAARVHEENDPATETTLLDPDSVTELTDEVEDGEIHWEAPDDDSEWRLLSFWERGTGIAVPGMSPEPSFKIDFYSEAGTQAFIDFYEEQVFTETIGELLAEVNGDFFKDSYGADDMWTPDLLSEFEERRGYSLRPYLAAILQYYATFPGDGLPNNEPLFDFPDETGERVRNDHRQTLSDLYAENHISLMNEWTDSYEMDYRGQVGYSEIVDPQQAAAAIDVPETESLYYGGNPDGYRAQSGAVHMTGKSEYSTEVAPVGGLAYAQSWTDLIGRIDNNFAGGVNRSVLHVFNYRDTPDSSWPGFAGFGHGFSAALSTRVPKWEHAPIAAQYLARTQHVLQSGSPNRDVAVYQHTYTLPEVGAGTDGEGPVEVEPLPYWNDDSLRDSGYSYDFVGPHLLDQSTATVEDGRLNPDGPGYEAFIFNSEIGPGVWPETTSMPLETAKRLLEFAEDGFPVVFVGDVPDHVPGKPESDVNETLQSTIDQVLDQSSVRHVDSEADVPTALEELGVRPAAEPDSPSSLVTVRRSNDSAEYYYLHNQSGTENVSTEVALEGRQNAPEEANSRSAGRPYRLDPWSGSVEPIAHYEYDDSNRLVVEVDLEPRETEVIAIGEGGWQDDIDPVGVHVTDTDSDEVVAVDGTLKLRATAEGSYSASLSNGKTVEAEIGHVPDSQQLESWSLHVESWEPTEAALDADGGVAATETKTVPIDVELDSLRPWPEIQELADVSGVGRYETTVELGEDWDDEHGAILDLGGVFDTFRVWVNGEEVPTPDQVAATVDVGEYLESGSNTIEVEVVTTLRNRLRTLVDAQAERDRQDYGLHGPVELIPYREAPIQQGTGNANEESESAGNDTAAEESTLGASGPGFTVGATLLSLLGLGFLSKRTKHGED